MKYFALSTCLILLAITGCKAQVAEQISQAAPNIPLHHPSQTKNEKPCLNNLASSMAGCTNGASAQKRFVLVRSVAIPEN